MKKELIWWTTSFVIAVFLVGLMTGFEFKSIDIQLYDTYYVFPSLLGVLIILIISGLFRGLVKLVRRKLRWLINPPSSRVS